MRYRSLIFSVLLILGAHISQAQNGNAYLPDTSIRVMAYGSQRTLAWAGGFNGPQFANADLNNDGLQDLVVYEWYEELVRTFINKGTATVANYVYAPEYEKAFPHCYDYLKMEDYNRDGIPDLFDKGIQGFDVYRGSYVNNMLHFTFYKTLRFTAPSVGNINAYCQPSDIPGIIDIDGDGDLDFFAYGVNGSLIDFYKNCQVEHGLPKDSIDVCNPTHCWGHTFQGTGRGYTFGISGYKNSPTCDILGTFSCKMVNGEKVVQTTRHQGNCMLFLDYDGDGDIDMLDGNISFSDLQYLRNGRIPNGGTDSMVYQDTMWQAGGKRVALPNWPAPTYADADGDGKKDILISPHDFTSSENYKCIQLYKNTGTASAPQFTYQSDTFLIDRSIDAGTASYPVLYDYNKDGKLDLFVGSDGYYQPGGGFKSRISYYQNSKSGSTTTLTLVSNDFLGIGAQNFSGAAPAFGDLDGDGVDDMVIGHSDGTLSFYKNMAGSNLLQPQWVLNQLMMKSLAGDTINVGYYSSPYIYDINNDGKPDLLVGNQNGRIVYYRSSASGAGLSLSFVTDTLGDVKADSADLFSGFSSIWIGKIDVTNKNYLLTGNRLGQIVRYTGFQNGNVTTPYNLLDVAYNDINAGYRSTITGGDIDGDGKTELIVGTNLGGLFLYKQGPVLAVNGPEMSGNSGCYIYPNPANKDVTVKWEAEFATGNVPLQIVLFNTMGQETRKVSTMAGIGAVRISLAGLPSGFYSCLIRSGSKAVSLPLTVIE